MAEDENFPLLHVSIHNDPSLRIDKYRAHQPTATSLHPATLTDDGRSIEAVAKVTVTTSANPQLVDRLKQCASVHHMLQEHPSIIRVHGVKQQPKAFYLLLEKAICSLRDIINPTTPEMQELSEKIMKQLGWREIIRQLLHGLTYIHSKTDDVDDKISHRDIKPENLLIVELERDGTIAIKFTDFDSAKQMVVDRSTSTITTNVFTQIYHDPNISQKKDDGESVVVDDYIAGDVFSAGLVGYEVQYGKHMFKGKNDAYTTLNMLNNDRTNLANAPGCELAKNCFWTMTQPDPADRPSAQESENLPTLKAPGDHVQMLNEANETILTLGDSAEDKAIKDALNWTFFMVFLFRWMELPFVFPTMLRRSKYSNNLTCFLRLCRNLLIHMGEYEEELKALFGKSPTQEELLEKMLESVPRLLIHFYWSTKKHFPHLPCVKDFPEQCVKAYEEYMEREKAKIPNLEALYVIVCPPEDATAAVDEISIMQATFKSDHKKILQIINRSDSDFKRFREEMKKLEQAKRRLEKKVENLKKNERPQAEIDSAEEELKPFEELLQHKWMLESRDRMKHPEKHREGKRRVIATFFSVTMIIARSQISVLFH